MFVQIIMCGSGNLVIIEVAERWEIISGRIHGAFSCLNAPSCVEKPVKVMNYIIKVILLLHVINTSIDFHYMKDVRHKQNISY